MSKNSQLCFTDFVYTIKESNGFCFETNNWNEAMDYLAVTPDASLETSINVVENDNFLNEIVNQTWDGDTKNI